MYYNKRRSFYRKRQKIKVIMFLAAIIMVMSGVVISLFIIMSRKNKAADNKDQAENNPTDVTVFTETDDYIGIESIIEQDEAMIAVHYPKFNSELLDQQISSRIMQKVEAYKKAIEADTEENQLWITFDTWKNGTRYLSIRFDIYEYYDHHANGMDSVETMIIDLEKKEEILPNVLLSDSNYLELLSERAYLYFSSLEEYKESLDMLQAGLEPVPENFARMLFYDGNIELIFNKYQIADGSKGTPSFTISLDELEAYMNPDIDWSEAEEAEPEPGSDDKEDTEADEPEPPQEKEEELELTGDEKLIALTFDDGPHEENTDRLLNILEKEAVKATFFVLGSRAEYYPELVSRIVKDGHQLGSHTYNHKQLTSLSENDMNYEITGTTDLLREITGDTVTAMRPPYGAYNDKVRYTADMPVIMWSLDPEDWKYRDAEYVYQQVTEKVKDGDIILLHDIHKTTIDAAERIIPELKRQGYTFVTVDTLIKLRNGALDKDAVYTQITKG